MSMHFELGKAVDEEDFERINLLGFNFLQGQAQSCQ